MDALESILGRFSPSILKRPQSTPVPKESSRILALIIGIDEYAASGSKAFKNLKGAVKDALAFKSYLNTRLSVPDSQITTLYNSQATRMGIIKGIQSLADKKKGINYGDPIIIYFAGHGTETEKPVKWGEGIGKIQMIVPHDYRTPLRGRSVEGLLDRTINTLLAQLSKVKGDNITVILDCCHSGSGTRGDPSTSQVEDGNLQMRGIKATGVISDDIDRPIWDVSNNPLTTETARGSKIPSGFIYRGLRSHVILSACGEADDAWEEEDGGVFTKALLSELVATAGNVSYCDLILRIGPLTGITESSTQTPQCEGICKNRILWDSMARDIGLCFFNVSMVEGEYILAAGAAHAVTSKAEFAIYQTMDDYQKHLSLGTLVVESTGPFESTLVLQSGPNIRSTRSTANITKTPIIWQGTALALQTKIGVKEDLCLSITEPGLLRKVRAIAKELRRPGPNQKRVSINEGTARMSLSTEQGFVVFDTLNPLMTKCGFTRMPFRVKMDKKLVENVIQAAAHFDWNLLRGACDLPEDAMEQDNLQIPVDLEFRKVAKRHGRSQAVGPNLNENNHINLVVGRDAYGVKLVNHSKHKLYPYLFFFDCSNLKIEFYYDSATSHESPRNAPLQPRSSLTIGYGDGGWQPWVYSLREPKTIVPGEIEQDGQDMDVGFLKLFLSTKPINLSYIEQGTPFSTRFKPGSRGGNRLPLEVDQVWDTRLITVVQRRTAEDMMDIDS